MEMCFGKEDSNHRVFLLLFCLLIPPSAGAQSESEPRVRLVFGGDCLLAEHYETAAGDNIHRAFDGFDLFAVADIAMVNLECPVTQRGKKVKKPYNFRMQPRFLEVLSRAGIDLVNLANNHIFDYGETGLFDTIHHLESAGIRHVGAGRTREEAHSAVLFDIRGIRIAFLGYYGGGEAPAATEMSGGVAVRSLEVIEQDVRRVQQADSADIIIVNLHWGVEKATTPEPDQVRFARSIVDAGADVVVGHHPHVLQAVERYGSGVIAYSLGNLVFGGNSRETYDTALLHVDASRDSVSYSIVPVRMEQWNLRELKGAEADALLGYVRTLGVKQEPHTTKTEVRQ
jgi:poly-gamma-glutamate synthesis protein (capsule biosynthesis protein)